MIKIENVKKQFIKTNNKKEKIPFYAVNGISFTANDNEIIGILGPNGAGKTTLLRIIAGIMNATSGEVSIDDMNYKENAIEIKKRIAFLSGNTKLYERISPYESLFGAFSSVICFLTSAHSISLKAHVVPMPEGICIMIPPPGPSLTLKPEILLPESGSIISA